MQVEASSDDRNSFIRREAKFSPNVLVKLSSSSEAMEKERGRAFFLRKKDQRAEKNPQTGQTEGHVFQRGEKKKMYFKRKSTQKKRKKGECFWNASNTPPEVNPTILVGKLSPACVTPTF